MSVDPVRRNSSSQFGFNRYAYADNDPYGKTDTSGAESASITLGNTYRATPTAQDRRQAVVAIVGVAGLVIAPISGPTLAIAALANPATATTAAVVELI
jgi:hypothetical protein